MKFELRWTVDAVQDLRLLDSASADRITKKVSWFCSQTNPLRHSEPLTGAYKGIHRFRVADYRVLFEIDAKGRVHVLTVLRVKHRREVYR
jgi:addiction module RelE/StbE family toxin